MECEARVVLRQDDSMEHTKTPLWIDICKHYLQCVQKGDDALDTSVRFGYNDVARIQIVKKSNGIVVSYVY